MQEDPKGWRLAPLYSITASALEISWKWVYQREIRYKQRELVNLVMSVEIRF